MAGTFVIHMGTGTFLDLDECDIVRLDDMGTDRVNAILDREQSLEDLIAEASDFVSGAAAEERLFGTGKED